MRCVWGGGALCRVHVCTIWLAVMQSISGITDVSITGIKMLRTDVEVKKCVLVAMVLT